jgi:hypothetical protein
MDDPLRPSLPTAGGPERTRVGRVLAALERVAGGIARALSAIAH